MKKGGKWLICFVLKRSFLSDNIKICILSSSLPQSKIILSQVPKYISREAKPRGYGAKEDHNIKPGFRNMMKITIIVL